MTIVTVAATKGGASKTCTAVCLSLEAAAQNFDVLLIDADPQGSGAKWAPELAVSAPDISSPDDVLAAAGRHRLVFVDTPPGADSRLVAAIQAADLVVAPTALGPGDIDALLDLTRMVDPDLVVPTRLDGRRAIHRHALDYLAAKFGDRLTTPVPAATAVEWAQAAQEPLPPLSPPALAYRSVLNQLLGLASVEA